MDRCYKCGRKGHVVTACNERIDIFGEPVVRHGQVDLKRKKSEDEVLHALGPEAPSRKTRIGEYSDRAHAADSATHTGNRDRLIIPGTSAGDLRSARGLKGPTLERSRGRKDKSRRRECELCRKDISEQPEMHQRCLKCFKEFDSDGNLKSARVAEACTRSKKRTCCECGSDISKQPASHWLCPDCFHDDESDDEDEDDYY